MHKIEKKVCTRIIVSTPDPHFTPAPATDFLETPLQVAVYDSALQVYHSYSNSFSSIFTLFHTSAHHLYCCRVQLIIASRHIMTSKSVIFPRRSRHVSHVLWNHCSQSVCLQRLLA